MSPKLRASIHRVLFATSALTASVAYAGPQETDTNEIAEIVIVTGSYIRGTAEDAALPVDVFTSEDLEKQGSPAMVDLIKSIPAVQGVIGESNQFLVNQGAGTGNINLRGLGATRTLVLLNGRRLAASPTGNGVDTNLLPTAAIGRIEVLKDGAAATYGSDAIGGVVNFITKENQDGLALDGSYTHIDGSDGDYGANISYGWSAGASSGLIAAGYRHRSELDTSERDWAVRGITENPQGGWSLASNPGTFSTSSGVSVVDPACESLGGQIVGGICRFQYIVFDNIVEKEDHYQVFADYNLDIGDSTTFHAEALYAMHDVPEEGVSPTYGPNQGPNGGAPNYFIPLANPGLQALLATNALTAAQRTALTTSNYGVPGVIASGLLWRPFAQGGNPITGSSQENERKFDGFRVSAGFTGEFGSSISWSTTATYGENSSEISTPDVLVSRLGLALRGLGGPNCTGTTAGANGCEWLNPFSTGVQSHAITGAVNNVTYTPGMENSAELARWLTTPNSYEERTTLLTVEAVLSGESGIQLPGGALGWAFGTQYRDTGVEHERTDDFADADLTPCAASPINPAAVCNPENGALSFYGPGSDYDLTQDMYAVFGELSLPITDSFQAQLAVRHEDYGGRVGATTNPKLSLRWQATDWLALRGSAGTTFRAPPQTSLSPDYSTTLAYTYGAYRAYDTYGNPDLKPEEADTFNVGFILNVGDFGLTVDYWDFTFKDQLTTETAGQIVSAFFGSGAAGQDHCGDPAYAELEARFTFSAAGCGASNLLRTASYSINAASDVKISGIDASTYYMFDGVAGGALTVGVDGTYNLEYEVGESVFGGILLDPAQDLIGTRGGRANTQTEWKANAYVDLSTGIHNVRWTARYIDGVEDVRGGSTFAGLPDSARQIDDFLTHDLVYRVELPAETILTASILNIFDEDPPFTRLDLSYEPFLANPLGRQVKLGVSKRF